MDDYHSIALNLVFLVNYMQVRAQKVCGCQGTSSNKDALVLLSSGYTNWILTAASAQHTCGGCISNNFDDWNSSVIDNDFKRCMRSYWSNSSCIWSFFSFNWFVSIVISSIHFEIDLHDSHDLYKNCIALQCEFRNHREIFTTWSHVECLYHWSKRIKRNSFSLICV